MPTITLDDNSLNILRNTKAILVNGGQSACYSDSIRDLAKYSVNLCRSCVHEFAECDGNTHFGSGKGNDNVYDCDKFVLLEGKPKW